VFSKAACVIDILLSMTYSGSRPKIEFLHNLFCTFGVRFEDILLFIPVFAIARYLRGAIGRWL